MKRFRPSSPLPVKLWWVPLAPKKMDIDEYQKWLERAKSVCAFARDAVHYSHLFDTGKHPEYEGFSVIEEMITKCTAPHELDHAVRYGNHFVAALSGDRTVGLLSFHETGEGILHTRFTAVHPLVQGKLIATRLQRAMFGWGRKHGYTEFHSDVRSTAGMKLMRHMVKKPRTMYQQGKLIGKAEHTSFKLTPNVMGGMDVKAITRLRPFPKTYSTPKRKR